MAISLAAARKSSYKEINFISGLLGARDEEDGIFHREIHRPAESLIEHKLTRIEVKNGMKRKLTAIVLRYEVENLWVRAGGHCLSG